MNVLARKSILLIAGVFLAWTAGASAAQDAAAKPAWQEQYAYTLGMQAYVFGFPYVYLPSLRWDWVTQPKPTGSITPYAPLNHFYNVRDLATAEYRDGGSPNNDALYSSAWVDVTKEPIILSHPEMGDRYFTFEIAGIDSDNFAYVGKRTTGGKAGSFAIVGPNWKGALPEGVKALPTSRTNSVLILGRTLVDGQADVPAVRKLQDQYTLVPLSLWGKQNAMLPESRDVWAPFDPKTDPLAEWKTMNKAMTENPPEARLAKLVELFARVGIGPGQDDFDGMDTGTKRGLARAAVDGRALLNDVIRSGALGKQVNGWNIPPSAVGRAGLSDDFLLRAALQALSGIISNDPAEAVYFNTALDATGQAFDGTKRYTLRFPPGQLPQVEAFWSITMYDPTYNLVDNSIDRYSIGNRTPNLKQDADGGLTLYIQSESPGMAKESNWLPSTKSGSFFVILRTYMPGPEIVEQKWAPPRVVPVL
ncbi:DUF1254 domain-containing protein [Mesorhizobium waimense]|uniref:DUF1254 domain-containing protein n=1 Tax=Mesorhizobium waimense TaxID=1300307 RepID=A0A3A5JZ77_9HYPH|nr:DUF1254 domain-containing protein [Mesorhizobium waimense]RJT28118.1 DUF1254 domain-containing protein [Mesorhizobium waimense]